MKFDSRYMGSSVAVCFHRAFDMTADATEGGFLYL